MNRPTRRSSTIAVTEIRALANEHDRNGASLARDIAVELRFAEKRYGAVQAVAPTSIQVEQCQTVALLGPSGAGKTTLLRLIAGEEPPTSGAISLHGRELSTLTHGRELASLVGMIHQQFDLVPNLSALQNTLAGLLGQRSFVRSLASLAIPFDRNLAESALAQVGLSDRSTYRVGKLSGGEQQRVALARVLVQNPQIILADEPVASLDPARSEEVLQLLTTLATDSCKTVIASMHSVEMARTTFDRLIGLRNGHLQFDLPASEVTDEMLSNLYTLEGLRAES